jgi:hypothetical protein
MYVCLNLYICVVLCCVAIFGLQGMERLLRLAELDGDDSEAPAALDSSSSSSSSSSSDEEGDAAENAGSVAAARRSVGSGGLASFSFSAQGGAGKGKGGGVATVGETEVVKVRRKALRKALEPIQSALRLLAPQRAAVAASAASAAAAPAAPAAPAPAAAGASTATFAADVDSQSGSGCSGVDVGTEVEGNTAGGAGACGGGSDGGSGGGGGGNGGGGRSLRVQEAAGLALTYIALSCNPHAHQKGNKGCVNVCVRFRFSSFSFQMH